MQEYEVFVALSISDYISVVAETEDEAIEEAKKEFNSYIDCIKNSLHKSVNACVVGTETDPDEDEGE